MVAGKLVDVERVGGFTFHAIHVRQIDAASAKHVECTFSENLVINDLVPQRQGSLCGTFGTEVTFGRIVGVGLAIIGHLSKCLERVVASHRCLLGPERCQMFLGADQVVAVPVA